MEYIINSLERRIPNYIEGIGELKAYEGKSLKANQAGKLASKENADTASRKVVPSLREAVIRSGLKDGMRISFHHHLRNGDYVLNMVMDVIAGLGIKDITICASSLISAHEPLIGHIKNGVVTGIETSGIRGELAKEIVTNCILEKPVIFRSHGGRARAIENGEIKIDIAFIAASCCDEMGNMNGQKGKSAFGSMGYPMVDAYYADKVVAITDNLVEYPVYPVSIPQTVVDYVVVVDQIGNPEKISEGATRMTKNPQELVIAEYAGRVLIESGFVKQGFSFQAGSGGASLAVAKYLKEYMKDNGITGSFASGGITSYMVEMLEEGLFKALLDTQTFDCIAAKSLERNKNHIEMSASMYANPISKGCTAEKLDIMILSATEVDTSFNINAMTASTGVIMGAIGGHPDTAAGAKLTVCVTPLIRKRIPIIVDEVLTVITPGNVVDVVVTDRGIAVNPNNRELLEKLSQTDLPICTIEELKEMAEKITGKPEKIEFGEKIVGVIEYRDGTIIDVIRQVI
ncbi:MAG TPA: citrate lyase subunit alpha [Clostridia bacterium]|nr:citrate lyase subunit alpha [Clostridia bacterium]